MLPEEDGTVAKRAAVEAAVKKSWVLHYYKALSIVSRRLDEHYAQRGYDMRAAWVLMAVEATECSQKDLCEVLEINPNVMVELIDRMEVKRLVRRGRNPVNRRENVIQLTAKGRQEVKWIHENFDAAAREVWRPLDIPMLEHISNFARAIIDLETTESNSSVGK